jgi:uncharacterized FAD-dependent dehydrogenase
LLKLWVNINNVTQKTETPKTPSKKHEKFDVIIVGAGPAGIFAAYEIVNKSPKTKIALIEMGDRIEKRKKSDVMTGFGGAGTYSDGKLHFDPKLSHERTFHLITPSKYKKLLERIEQIFIDFGIEAVSYPKNPEVVEEFQEETQRNGLELIVRRSKHVGTDNLKKMMTDFQKYLEDRGVDFISKTEVKDLIVVEGVAKGVITKKGDYFGNHILLAPGRVKARWLQKVGDKHGLEHEYGMVEVGVRVEFPEKVMKRHAEALYEIVFKIRTDTYDDVIRTFCSCPKGFVATELYDEYGCVCVNGHSDSHHNSPNSNFAFVCEVNLTEPVENSIQYAQSIAQVATTIGGGKPILQRLADLKKGRRSTWHRINKSTVKPSLTDVTPGDISMALPHRVVTNILEGLGKLDRVMPGINSGSTLLYAPEVKFRSSRAKTTKGMETTIKNLFVAGDASGISGTITGAAATGLMAAKGILRKSSE